MRDSELIKQRAEALLQEIERYIPEEDREFVLTKIEIAMLRAHVDATTNVHDEETEGEQ
jgi:hypothetical protein